MTEIIYVLIIGACKRKPNEGYACGEVFYF
jgi:hypothetical protein